jgi:hypothetical protein
MKILPALGLVFCLAISISFGAAPPFENGNFSQGKLRWEGDGRIAYLKPDGTIESADDASDFVADTSTSDPNAPDAKVPIMEMKLNKANFKHFFQSFTTDAGTHALNITVVYKGSAGFKRNIKSPNYSPFINWGADDQYQNYSDYVFPKTDMFVRLDRQDNYSSYYLHTVKPSDEWQTAKFKFDDVGEGYPCTINIFCAPGDGSFYVKSVSITSAAK